MLDKFCVFPLIVLLLLNFKTCEGTIPLLFIQQPVNQNISQGDQATFNCTAFYSFNYYWLVNKLPLAHSNNNDRGITKSKQSLPGNLYILLLFVPGTIQNDNITVQCFIYSSNATTGSELGKLRVQGILDPVSNLQAEWLNSSSLHVSFSPPYTLVGVPITNYTINFTSLDTKAENEHGNITSLTTHSQSTVVTDLSWCITYNISVSAWNSIGEGNQTFLFKKGLLAPLEPFNVTIKKHSSTNKQFISLDITVNASYPHVPENFTVTVYGTKISVTLSTVCTVDTLTCYNNNFELRKLENSDDLIQIVVNLTDYITVLEENQEYNVTVSVANCNGIASTYISTTGFVAGNSVHTWDTGTKMNYVSYTSIDLKEHNRVYTSSFQQSQPLFSAADLPTPSLNESSYSGRMIITNTIWISGLVPIGLMSIISAFILMPILIVYRRKIFKYKIGNNLHLHFDNSICNPLQPSSTYETIKDIIPPPPQKVPAAASPANDVELMNCPAYMDPRQANLH